MFIPKPVARRSLDRVASVTTLPSELLVSNDLAAGTATVTVNAGGQTIATFLDTVIPVIPTTGLLQVCKVGGSGIAVGTNFTFNVAGTPVTVPAVQLQAVRVVPRWSCQWEPPSSPKRSQPVPP